MSFTISFDSTCGNICADAFGQYHITIFGFITDYTGPVTLVVFTDDSGKEYTALTNELGAVGFHVSGKIPEGEKKKIYPILLSTSHRQQRSFFTVEANKNTVTDPASHGYHNE